MAASVNGAVLSSLFFDHASFSGDQEGFLLGRVISHTKDTISDTQISKCNVETVTNVYAYLPCRRAHRFYDNRGHLLDQQLSELIKDKKKEIVGWYRFRRNSTLHVSMRETVLHQKLLKYIQNVEPQNFLFMLCNAGMTENKSTHTFDHAYHRYLYNSFTRVPVTILNLGHTAPAQYKKSGSVISGPGSVTYPSTVQQFVSQFQDESGHMLEEKKIQTMAFALLEQLDTLSQLVGDSEREMFDVEAEVDEYKEKVRSQKEAKQAVLPLPPDPGSPTQLKPTKSTGSPKMTKRSMSHKTTPTSEVCNPLYEQSLQSRHTDSLLEDNTSETSRSLTRTEFQPNLIDPGVDTMIVTSNMNKKTKPEHTNSKPVSNFDLLSSTLEDNLPEAMLKPAKPGSSTESKSNKESTKITAPSPDKASKSNDHFSFVDSLLLQAKENDSGGTSMNVPTGDEVRMPASVAEQIASSSRNKQAKSHVQRTAKEGHDGRQDQSTRRRVRTRDQEQRRVKSNDQHKEAGSAVKEHGKRAIAHTEALSKSNELRTHHRKTAEKAVDLSSEGSSCAPASELETVINPQSPVF